jgi:hypothetical protein
MATDATDLAELDDPSLVQHWAKVRSQLALTPKDDPRHADLAREYAAARAEFARRLTMQGSS